MVTTSDDVSTATREKTPTDSKRKQHMNKFGERLKSLRESKKLALAEACRLLSIPQSRLHELERGVRIPTPGQVERLEKFYQVDPGLLAALMQ